MFFYYIYYASMIILIPGLIFAFYAQIKVKSSFKKYSKIHSESDWAANEMTQMLLERQDCRSVDVKPIHGTLTDNYNPKDQTIYLSESVYKSTSIAALSIAAHETGHALQHNNGYAPLAFRSFFVKVVNIGSRLAVPLAIIGLILTYVASQSPIGNYILAIGIAAYSLTAIFALVTLPVEFNASRRAKRMLRETGILTESEMRGTSKVLNAAALTYVAALTVSLLYLFRFIIILASLRKRN